MSGANLQNLSASSLFPGLQNIGTAHTVATISGLIPASGTLPGNLVGSFQLYFPKSNLISAIRVNLPDANGDLATYWFPVVGTVELYDATTGITFLMYVQNSSVGRLVSFNLVNGTVQDITISGYRIDCFAHLYSYPW